VTDRPKKLLIRSKLQNSDVILVEIRDYGTGLADSEKVYEAFYTTKEKGMEWIVDLPFDCGSARRPPGDHALSRPGNDFLFHLASSIECAHMKHDSPIVYVWMMIIGLRERYPVFCYLRASCRAFASAAEYLVFNRPDSPACLVLDLELPGMSGLELQREIAGLDAPPVVFVTDTETFRHPCVR